MPRGVLTASVLVAAALVTGAVFLASELGESEPPDDPRTSAEPVARSAFVVFLRGPVAGHEELAEQFAAIPGVVDVEYVSKDEAVDRLEQNTENRDLGDAIRELDGNPLPASYEVSFDEVLGESEGVALLIAAAGENRSVVDDIDAFAPD